MNASGPLPRPSNEAYWTRPSHALHPFRIKLPFPTTVLTWVEVIFIIFAYRVTVHVWLHERCDFVLFYSCFWLCISVCVHVCLHVLQLHVEARGHLMSCLFFWGDHARQVGLANQRAPGPVCLQLSVCLSVGLHRIPPCWGLCFFNYGFCGIQLSSSYLKGALPAAVSSQPLSLEFSGTEPPRVWLIVFFYSTVCERD